MDGIGLLIAGLSNSCPMDLMHRALATPTPSLVKGGKLRYSHAASAHAWVHGFHVCMCTWLPPHSEAQPNSLLRPAPLHLCSPGQRLLLSALLGERLCNLAAVSCHFPLIPIQKALRHREAAAGGVIFRVSELRRITTTDLVEPKEGRKIMMERNRRKDREGRNEGKVEESRRKEGKEGIEGRKEDNDRVAERNGRKEEKGREERWKQEWKKKRGGEKGRKTQESKSKPETH
ncbi:Myosin-M heavy chain, partial [Ophiophagus hannah]